MNLIKREIKEWGEFFIRNISERLILFRSTIVIKKVLKNRFEPCLRIEYPKIVELDQTLILELTVCKYMVFGTWGGKNWIQCFY